MDKRFNVVEVTQGPKAGRIVVLPVRRTGFRLALRGARYRLLNADFEFADGFAQGVVSEARGSHGFTHVNERHSSGLFRTREMAFARAERLMMDGALNVHVERDGARYWVNYDAPKGVDLR